MKLIAIATKDLISSFRSSFALIFMFGIPLLVTGMFYLMLGNLQNPSDGFDLPRTKVVIVNLDEGDPQVGQLGQNVVDTLQNEEFSSLMELTVANDAAAARQSIDNQQAGVAIIIPANFSTSFTDSGVVSEIELYKDPTLTIAPEIVESMLSSFVDHLAGIKITAALALQQAESGAIEYSQIEKIVSDYLASEQSSVDPRELIEQRLPVAVQEKSLVLSLVAPIMGGMLIFFAFFTGANTASSILREDEGGTLQRMFTTPTTQAEILGGKFLSVGLTVLVQVIVLFIAARLLFGIEWGTLPDITLVVVGIVSSASAFGIFICSLLKNTRQGGTILGGLLTVTGMVGMMDIFTGSANSAQKSVIPLLAPQGWAARSLLLSMESASFTQILPYTLVLLAVSAAFFAAGVWRIQKRFA